MKSRQGSAMSTTYRVTTGKADLSKVKIQAGLLHVNHLQGD